MSMISNLVDTLKSMSMEKWDPLYWAAQACPVLSCPVDWKETPQSHIFMVDLPGLNKDDVNLEVDDGRILQISGERRHDDVDNHEEAKGKDVNNNKKWHRIERHRGKFCRRFRLPEDAKVDEIKASMENGVLKVIIPKQEVKKPETTKVIQIEEKSSN